MKRIYTLIIILSAAAASVALAKNNTSNNGTTSGNGGNTGTTMGTGTTTGTGNATGNTTGNANTTGNTTGAGNTTGNVTITGTGNTNGTGVSGSGTNGTISIFIPRTSEQRFVQEASQGNLQEIMLGQLAETNSADTNVQSFGALLVTDHSAAQQQLETIASTLGITLPSTNIRAQAIFNQLSSLSGTQFDQTFTALMVHEHIVDIQRYELAALRSPDTAVRDYARTNLPVLMDHLVVALTIRESLMGNTAALASVTGPNGILTLIRVPSATTTGTTGTGTTGTGTGTTTTGTGTTGTGTTGTGTGTTGTGTTGTSGTTGTGTGTGSTGTTGTGTGGM